MTEKEIIRSYKQALNKRKQIGVLADLNACPREDIVNILSAAGVYNKPGKKPAKKEDIPKVKRTVVKAVKSGGYLLCLRMRKRKWMRTSGDSWKRSRHP